MNHVVYELSKNNETCLSQLSRAQCDGFRLFVLSDQNSERFIYNYTKQRKAASPYISCNIFVSINGDHYII